MITFFSKKYTIAQNTLLNFLNKHTSLSDILFLVLIIFESLYLIYSFFPEFNTVTALNTDFVFHMNRFYGLSEAINQGSFPFYINTHTLNGYGYGVNLFYPDLTLLPFTFLIKPLGLAYAYKIMFLTYTLLGAIFSFYAAKKITKSRLIAYIFTLLYTFALYKTVDFAYRGAMAEFLAFTFVPLIANGFYEIIYNNYKKWYLISLGFSLLIYTHFISSLLIFLVLIIFTIRVIFQKRLSFIRFKYLLLASTVSLLLSMYAILPLLEQLQSNTFYLQTYPLIEKISDRASAPKLVVWGLFDGLNKVWLHLESFGILITFCLFPRLILKRTNRLINFADFCLLFGIVLLFMITSLFPWNLFPFNKLSIIQFPFRLLLPATFLLSIAGAIYTAMFMRIFKHHILISLFLIFGITFMIRTTGEIYNSGRKHIVITNETETIYGLDIMDVVGAEYLPSKIPFIQPDGPDYYYKIAYIINRDTIISKTESDEKLNISSKRSNEYFAFDISVDTVSNITLPLVYYKGYKAILNGNSIDLKESKDGLIELKIPANGYVKVWYAGTTIQKISFAISLSILLALFIYICISYRKNRTII